MKSSRAGYLFFGIYFVEAMVGYVTLTILSYYLNNVLLINPIIIGILGSVSLLPMVLKVFLGPFMDRFKIPGLSGRRRPYILIGTILNAVFVSLFFLPQLIVFPNAFIWVLVVFVIIWFLQSLGITLMDVGVDAIGTMYKQQKSSIKISVLMFLGTTAGGMIPTIFLTPIFMISYPLGFIITGMLSLLGLFFVQIFREDELGLDVVPAFNLQAVKTEFRKTPVIFALILAFFLLFDKGLFEFTLERFVFIAYGLTLGDLALINLTIMFGAIGGMIFGYFFMKKIKNKIVLFVTAASFFVPELIWATLLPLGLLSFPIFYVTSIISAVGSALYTMAYMALYLDLSNPKIGATMIAVFLAVANLGQVVAIFISGFFPLIVIFIMAAIFSGVRLVPLAVIPDRNQTEDSVE
ncbi:MAG: MFS transporter [Candidatus Helarchaeota archaeon]